MARARNLLKPPGPIDFSPRWPEVARAALIHVVSLAHVALTTTRSWCADSRLARVRLRARVDRLEQEVALLREEIRIKDARLGRIPAAERPRYPPKERLAILALRAARGWNAARAARAFLVSAPTIAEWMRRLDEQGADALVRLPVPVNRFPDFVSVVVQQLRATCPLLGKVRIAHMLARAGLALSASTVKRALDREPLRPPPLPSISPAESSRDITHPDATSKAKKKIVTALRPHHVWHCDMTVLPVVLGFWVPWLPLALAQRWPFGVYVGIVLDHYSRAIVARGVYEKQPTAEQVCDLLDRAMKEAHAVPRYIVSDQGPQFRNEYRSWCRKHGVRPRFGAVGQHGSIAVIERFIRSLKDEAFGPIVVPLSLPLIEREIDFYASWYHESRPHQGLGGLTPNDRLSGRVSGGEVRERDPPRRSELRPFAARRVPRRRPLASSDRRVEPRGVSASASPSRALVRA